MPEEKYVEELAKTLPQGTDKTPEMLDSALKGLPDRCVFTHRTICIILVDHRLL